MPEFESIENQLKEIKCKSKDDLIISTTGREVANLYSNVTAPIGRESLYSNEMSPELRRTIDALKEGLQPEFDRLYSKMEMSEVNIIACIRMNPVQNFRLLSKFGALTFAGSLAFYGIGKIVIINPFLSAFGLLSCLAYLLILRDR